MTINEDKRVSSSYRDPKGYVYRMENKIYRSITQYGIGDFEAVDDTGLFEELVKDKLLLSWEEVSNIDTSQFPEEPKKLIEHPKLDFISYPYEWTFSALKKAALLHLDIQIRAIEKNVVLTDASAYNIQFKGPTPVFIDHLSFRPYEAGEYWLAHRQFCEQFLNPLVLQSYTGVLFNSWYRGALEGISVADLAPLLPWQAILSYQVLTNIILVARFERKNKGRSNSEISVKLNQKKLPKTAYKGMLSSLRDFISKLKPLNYDKTVWEDYVQNNIYKFDETKLKKAFVSDFISTVKPEILWDIGCNTGDYSQIALESGATCAIGFEYDPGALELSFARATKKKLNFLPLFLNAANPSPSQGWMQKERVGLSDRYVADALIALAILHHLCIAHNIPLQQVVIWLVEMAPKGIIEFIPKTDPMVQELIKLREDIFYSYSESHFEDTLSTVAKIENTRIVTESGRKLYSYSRLR